MTQETVDAGKQVDAPILMERWRGELMETQYAGHVVVAGPDSEIVASAGNPDRVVYFRSAAKIFQAIPLIESGAAERFGFATEHLAISCSSHNGASKHQQLVREILQAIGLPEDALQCGMAQPMDPEAAALLALGMEGQSPVQCECSGKHAAMLAVCIHEGYPFDSYLEPDHPLQQRILDHLSTVAGIARDEFVTGMDGCGLPTYGAPLHAIARAYSVVAGAPSPALRTLRAAMLAHPEIITGDGEFDTELMRITEGRVAAKLGADGLLCMAVPDYGLGIAISIESGVEDAHGPVTVKVLCSLSVLDDSTLDKMRNQWHGPVTNFHGKEVGHIETPFELTPLRAGLSSGNGHVSAVGRT